MNIRLKIISSPVSPLIKKRGLQELFKCTANAFNSMVPSLQGLSYRECLKQYALFTSREVERSIQAGQDQQAIKTELFKQAYHLGQKIRQRLHIRTSEEVMDAGKIIYDAIGINFEGNSQGDITISRCFFSEFYSSQVCQVISALDAGILSGLSGSGQLSFSQRITEGGDCCKARFSWQGLRA